MMYNDDDDDDSILQDGVHTQEVAPPQYTEDQLKLMTTQDTRYVNYKRSTELKVSGVCVCVCVRVRTHTHTYTHTYAGIPLGMQYFERNWELVVINAIYTRAVIDITLSDRNTGCGRNQGLYTVFTKVC